MQSQELWNQFSPGPIQTLDNYASGISLNILRLDLLQSWSSGNKYYKLKYPLQNVLKNNIRTIVSKGGMFSNHLAALAEACYAFHIQLVCIVRSFVPDEHNPTIRKLKELNVIVEYVTPEEYDQIDQEMADERFPDAFFIPEGGLSPDGLRGAAEISDEIKSSGFNHILIAGGSMCTACGLIKSLPEGSHLHIVPAWKGCSPDYIQTILSANNIQPVCHWDIWPDYHVGGFGKFNRELIDFMTAFTSSTGIVLDPVYTGKLLMAVTDKIKNLYFSEQDSVLAIHTGGLQGLAGYAYRFPEDWMGYLALAEELLLIGRNDD
jgi:1-aminocyclopropane-1-carboxylate deaminase